MNLLRRAKTKFASPPAALLILASQRIETVIVDWFGATPTLKKWVATDVTTRRGAPPSLVEWLILAWVFGESVEPLQC